MKTRRVLMTLCILLLYLVLVWIAVPAMHLSPASDLTLKLVLALLGLLAAAYTLWYLGRLEAGQPESAQANLPDSVNLRSLIRDAEGRIRHANRPGIKSLTSMPLLYVLGDENSVKTQTVLQSGLDPELLSGAVLRDSAVIPTPLVNLWLAGNWILTEAGGAMLKQPALWDQYIKATVPARLGSVFSKRNRLPARVALVCVSIERLLAPNTDQQVRELAQLVNQRLRKLSQTLGVALPLYVLFTKLDTIASFADYARSLTEDEVRFPLGALLETSGFDAGIYSDTATARVNGHLDSLIAALSKFRLEVLMRGGQPKELATAYEFPRDLRKLRDRMAAFLVEVARPTQIGVNPFLRGFFFSGVRPHVVQATLDLGSSAPQVEDFAVSEATQVFFKAPAAAPKPAVRPAASTTRVPQWVFLPRLMSGILLSDRSALEASRSSTRTQTLRRTLLGCATAALLLLLVFATVSFFNNLSLIGQVNEAQLSLTATPAPAGLASLPDLQNLDRLRLVLDQLEQYQAQGAPWTYRWGLFRGDELQASACRAYSNAFRNLLLARAQSNILAGLHNLPASPGPSDSYIAAYYPLKAYLITAVNPNPDTPQDTVGFLPHVLAEAWSNNAVSDPATLQLAEQQFAFYARHLAAPGSCMARTGGVEDSATVAHVRIYLGGFEGFQHVYQSMLAAANEKTPPFTFNGTYPGSSQYVVDGYQIQGAFSKAGFAFMQDAILHPEKYFAAEQWVLGPSASAPIDPVTLPGKLKEAFYSNYILTWREYLKHAQVVGYQGFVDAEHKLQALDSNSSALLELFSLVSTNTAVSAPEISAAFQAPQAVVPPASGGDGRLIGPSNQQYIQALLGLEGAIKGMNANPLAANDPTAALPVIQAATSADQSAEALRNGFVPDPAGGVDKVTFALLEAPIDAANALAAQAPARAAGGAAKAFCDQNAPLFARFPFNPQASVEAAPEEVARVFAPGQGSFWQFYDSSLQALIVQQGNQFVPAPGSKVRINPAFLAFLNNALRLSKGLFPYGGSQPALDFSLNEPRAAGVTGADLNIDGTELRGVGQSATFHWVSSPSGKITITTPTANRTFSGAWSILRFSSAAESAGPSRLKFSFTMNYQAPEVVVFDVSGSGASLLNPEFIHDFHCNANVAR